MDLKELKNKYGAFRDKYGLPNFEEINSIFDIEKIDEESEQLLKVIRKVMMDKIINFLGFLEMLNNPANAPKIYYQFFSSMTSEDKKRIDELYFLFGKLNLSMLIHEVEYSEEKEAKSIIEAYNKWKDSSKTIIDLLNSIMNPKNVEKKSRNYLG